MVQEIANQSLHLFLETLVQSLLKLTGIFQVSSMWALEEKHYVNTFAFMITFYSHARYANKGETKNWIKASECSV